MSDSKIEYKKRDPRVEEANKYYILLGTLYLLLFVVVATKTVLTMTYYASDWKGLNANMRRPNAPSQPLRGNIYSDEKFPLAISVPRYDVRLDFQASGFDRYVFLNHVDSLARQLGFLFGDRTASSYKAHLLKGLQKESRSWKIVSREISHTELKTLFKMSYFNIGGKNKTGLTTTRFVRRVMPYGSLAQRTIGGLWRDPDSLGLTHGNSGLEMAFDSVLCGKQGLDRFIFVPRRWIRDPIKTPQNGMDVFTTLNVDIQDISERSLRKTLKEVNADWGCAVVMEVHTGAIKAMVNLDRLAEGVYSERVNHTLSALLEPGSTFKGVTMLAALDREGVHPTDTVDVGNGRLKVGRGLVIVDHNASKGGYGKITFSQAMERSSNIGLAMAVKQTFGEENPKNNRAFLDALDQMNIFDKINLEIPGTTQPYINRDAEHWRAGAMPWISFGYQVQMPPIYTLRFYNAIANNGKMMEPYLVTKVADDDDTFYENGPKVINRKIARSTAIEQLQDMLRKVVTSGTGKAMDSPFVAISGKTGTAQISGGGSGYEGNGHNVTFCGYFPSEKPEYSCIVVVSRPRGVYPSGSIPGRVLREIAEQTVATKQLEEFSLLQADSTATFIERINGGLQESVLSAIDLVDVDDVSITGDGEWCLPDIQDSLPVLRCFEPLSSRMPKLKGMAASDAVYLCEMLGLQVQLNGKGGRVISQSILPENAIKKGYRITLTLK